MKQIFILFCMVLYLPASSQHNLSDYLLKSVSEGMNTWAIIIANEDYQSYSEGYTENVELSIYHAERFQQLLIKKLGVPAGNITLYPDATNTNIKLAIAKLQKVINKNSKVIFYYRGKLFRENTNSELFLVPVDSNDDNTFFMFGFGELQNRLAKLENKSTDIFLDALPEKSFGSQSMLENGFCSFNGFNIVSTNDKIKSYAVYKPNQSNPIEPVTKNNTKIPNIIITSPDISNLQTRESTILISGTVESDCPVEIVAINGEEASYNQNGSFSARAILQEGDNLIPVQVRNCAGWSTEIIDVKRTAAFSDTSSILEQNTLKIQGENYALLIGVSQYIDAMMPNLYYPIKDAARVKEVLSDHYSFSPGNIILLQNPVKSIIIKTLDSLSNILKPEDSFLLFYAGHGSWDDNSRMGYWLPSDAAAALIDNWIMNSIITGFMSEIPAKHVLVIADACFSGSIFRTRAFVQTDEKLISELYEKPSKKAMTSGDMTEVPDESVFMKYFIQKLEENNENYISSEKLFFQVKPQVVNNTDILPQYGIIKNAGDMGGDYIFFRK